MASAASAALPLAFAFTGRSAHARSRMAMGGRVALRFPFGVSALDPHRLDDPVAAILGDALFDTLYVREASASAPSLAEAEPRLDGEGLLVTVRRGLTTAEGRPIDARDVVFSLGRARRFGGRALLAELGTVERVSNEALRFSLRDPARLMTLLSSPVSAVLPIAFEPERPDGTGPFQAMRRPDALALARNVRAARGPSMLDEIVVKPASDLAESLRAFEGGGDDIGWLGAGLYSPRRGAKAFDAGSVGWVVLRAGRDASTWDSPGALQRMLDGIAPSKLAHLGLGPAWTKDREDGWGGPSGELLVRDDAPYLAEVARTVAALVSRPGHELTVRPIPNREIATRRPKRDHMLLLDFVRALGAGGGAAFAALSSIDEATTEAAPKPPRNVESTPVRGLARSMRVGVVGELHVQGARAEGVTLPVGEGGWDLGSATRARRPT